MLSAPPLIPAPITTCPAWPVFGSIRNIHLGVGTASSPLLFYNPLNRFRPTKTSTAQLKFNCQKEFPKNSGVGRAVLCTPRVHWNADGAHGVTRPTCCPFPENYFGASEKAICNEFRFLLTEAIQNKTSLPAFPEELLINQVDNTWRDTAGGVLGNWMGLIYQITHSDRRIPFMDHVNPDDPLNLKWKRA